MDTEELLTQDSSEWTLKLFGESSEEICRDVAVEEDSLLDLSPILRRRLRDGFRLTPKLVSSTSCKSKDDPQDKLKDYTTPATSDEALLPCPGTPSKVPKILTPLEKQSCRKLEMVQGSPEIDLHEVCDLMHESPASTCSHCSSCISGNLSAIESPQPSVVKSALKEEESVESSLSEDSIRPGEILSSNWPLLSGISLLAPSITIAQDSQKRCCSHFLHQDKRCKRKIHCDPLDLVLIMGDDQNENRKNDLFTSTPIENSTKFECTSLSSIQDEGSNCSSCLLMPKESKFFISSELVHSSDLHSREKNISYDEDLESSKTPSPSGSDKENVDPLGKSAQNRFSYKKAFFSRLSKRNEHGPSLKEDEKDSGRRILSQPIPSIRINDDLLSIDVSKMSSSQPAPSKNVPSPPMEKVYIMNGLDEETDGNFHA